MVRILKMKGEGEREEGGREGGREGEGEEFYSLGVNLLSFVI